MGNFENIWFVIPAYNEGLVSADVIREIKLKFNNIVVVNDSSTDNTAEVASINGAWVVNHPINLGQGAAIQTGITYALSKDAELIITFDADGQHRVIDVISMLDNIDTEEAIIICGSRFLGVEAINMSIRKKVLLKIATLFTKLITKVKVTDAHNGLRVITRKAALKINILQNKMAHATEIIAMINKMGITYREFPVQIIYTDYSTSKGQRISNSMNIVLDLLVGRISK